MKNLFEFGGSANKKQSRIFGILGGLLLFLVWYLVVAFGWINSKILPNPIDVICCFPELVSEGKLFYNVGYTVGLNLLGFIMALIVVIPIGFLIGIYPIFSTLFRKYFEALRFLPLPTVTGIFIASFGLGFMMKSLFLSFGITIFMLPALIQKVIDLQDPSNEKDHALLEAGKTMGYSNWQLFIYIYWPYVMDKVYQDIRSLVAVSYTYVVIAECLNKEGGIGSAIQTMTRQSRTPEIFAMLFIIVLIGILQDWIFKKLDPKIFPYHAK